MFNPAGTIAALALFVGLSTAGQHTSQLHEPPQFCSAIDSAVTAHHQQSAATAFCSSYLSIRPRTTTVDVTQTTTATTTVAVTVTTVYVTAIKSLAFPSSGCPTSPPSNKKRTAVEARSKVKPDCFSSWNQGPALSAACSCLSIPTPTSTSTSTDLVTTTATVDTTIKNPKHITTGESVTTRTVTKTTSTVTLYTPIVLQDSVSGQYASADAIDPGFSGGNLVYFNVSDIADAARFGYTFKGETYNALYINGNEMGTNVNETNGFSYYIVANAEFYDELYGDVLTPVSEGCQVGCTGFFGGTNPESGNSDVNYNGAWSLSGDPDEFEVYMIRV